jgi:hypothetical protein
VAIPTRFCWHTFDHDHLVFAEYKRNRRHTRVKASTASRANPIFAFASYLTTSLLTVGTQ